MSNMIVCPDCGFMEEYGPSDALAGNLAECPDCGHDLRDADIVDPQDFDKIFIEDPARPGVFLLPSRGEAA